MKFYCENCEQEVEVSWSYKYSERDEYLRVTQGRKSNCPNCGKTVFNEGYYGHEGNDGTPPKGRRPQKPRKPLIIGETKYFIHGRPKTQVVSQDTIRQALAERERYIAERENAAKEEQDGKANGETEEEVSGEDTDLPER